MTSNDIPQYVTVEILRSELGDLRAEMHSEFKDVHAEIQTVHNIATVNSAKIDAHWEAASMWFAIIAILVAVTGILVTFAAIIREIFKSKASVLTEQKVQNMINASISQSVNDAVAKALGISGKLNM